VPDQRKIAVIPIRACTDKQLTPGMIRSFILICSYMNRSGITWVGQKTMADKLGISQQAISKHLVKLFRGLVFSCDVSCQSFGCLPQFPDIGCQLMHCRLSTPLANREDVLPPADLRCLLAPSVDRDWQHLEDPLGLCVGAVGLAVVANRGAAWQRDEPGIWVDFAAAAACKLICQRHG